jgi:hypothetical protein
VNVGVLVQQSGQHGAAGTGETCEEVELVHVSLWCPEWWRW